MLLAHLHPFRDRLFQPLMHDPVSALSFNEQLPSGAARYVYRGAPRIPSVSLPLKEPFRLPLFAFRRRPLVRVR